MKRATQLLTSVCEVFTSAEKDTKNTSASLEGLTKIENVLGS